MKVLWIVNLIPSDLAAAIDSKKTVLGGWIESMAAELRENDDIELAIACKNSGSEKFYHEVNKIKYYSVSYTSKTSLEELMKRCREIIKEFQPDIIQIEGTEFLHALAMLKAAKEEKIKAVISLQGILNGQYNYQCGQLSIDDMMFSLSFTNIYSAWIMHLRKKYWYKPRMKSERDILEQADYLIGRTTWDKAHAYKINPNAKYYSCNRVLRNPFYEKQWKIDEIQRHTIYLGNGYFPLKGMHYMFMAIPELVREYPDLKVYVGGYKPYETKDKRSFLKKGYAAYPKKLVKDLNIENYIEFTGPLSAEQVADKLSKTHVYALCSAAENSPNTLGEAMVVGTPSVAAYVGGVSDMAVDTKEALFFRNDDPAILAWNIKRIFDNDELAQSLSSNAKEHALDTHDAKKNADKLISIYKDIME